MATNYLKNLIKKLEQSILSRMLWKLMKREDNCDVYSDYIKRTLSI